jgi:hypothetical protein
MLLSFPLHPSGLLPRKEMREESSKIEESVRVRRRRDASLLSSVTPSGLPVVCNESRTYETRRERMSESYATRLDLFCRYRQGEGREGWMEEE